MLDGSKFSFPNETWEKAFFIKAGNKLEETIKTFKEMVSDCFNRKIKLTPLGYQTWDSDDEFTDHADLANTCMYSYLRPAILSILLKRSNPGKEIKVYGLSEGGVFIYDGEKVEKKTLEEAFKDED